MELTSQIKSVDDITVDKSDVVEVDINKDVVDVSVIKTFGEDGTVDIAYVESKVVERELYPKSNCKRCFSRGAVGFDRVTETMVICECIKKVYRDIYESRYKGVKPEDTGLILMIDGVRFKVNNNHEIVKAV